jgi:hypothetical protein
MFNVHNQNEKPSPCGKLRCSRLVESGQYQAGRPLNPSRPSGAIFCVGALRLSN